MINKVIDTTSHSLLSIGDIQAVGGMFLNIDSIENNLSTEGFLHFSKTTGNIENIINTLKCETSLSSFFLYNSIANTSHTISSEAQADVFYFSHTYASAENNLISEGIINNFENVHHPYRVLQGLSAFFKTNKARYPYYVVGYFNNQIVFGSYKSVILKGIYERLKTEANLVYAKEMLVGRSIHSISSRSDMAHYIKNMLLNNISDNLNSINNIATYYRFNYIEPFLQEVNSEANIAYAHKHTNLEKIMFVFESNTSISFFRTGGIPKENVELLSVADVLAITKHENINSVVNSLVTHGQSDIRYGDILHISRLETIETSNNISLYVVQGVPNIVESLNTFVELTFVAGENYYVDTTEHLLTSFGDLSTGYQEALYTDEHVDIVDTVYTQQLFYIGPYNAELLIKSIADLMYYIKEAYAHAETDIINSYANTATVAHHSIEGMDGLFSTGDLQTEPIRYTEFLRDIIYSIGDTEYYIKYSEASTEDFLSSDNALSYSVGLKVLLNNLLMPIESDANISHTIGQTMLSDTNSITSDGDIVVIQGQNKISTDLLENIKALSNLSYFVTHNIESEHVLNTDIFLKIFYKHNEVEQKSIHVTSHGQSDYVVGRDTFISRKEELNTQTNLTVINNPGYLPEDFFVDSDANIFTVVGGSLSISPQQHYLSTVAYIKYAKVQVVLTDEQPTMFSQGDVQYMIDTPLEFVTNDLVSEAPSSNFTFFLDASLNNLLNNLNTQANTVYETVAPITITLNKQSGTGGTNSIISVKGFYTDPTSVTVPTRSMYNFKGYFESSFASDRQEVKLTGPSSGTNRRFIFEDNNAHGAPTMFLENLYNDSTLWRFHAVVKSTHAITHFDISDQTISAEQVSGNTAYTYIIDTPITSNMANYASGGLHYEFLDIGTDSTATVTILDTFTYISATKIVQKIDSTGNYLNLLNDTYSVNKTLYAFWADDKIKVVWKNYAGTILKTEWVSYTAYSSVVPNISYAPTGTSNTTQYTYTWPTGSHSITSDITSGTSVTYTETRTTNQYTITWKNYAGTTVKTETINYGSISTAPTGTTNTAQYTYAWPKASTTVTANETITETRTTKSYTITWYFYNGAVAKQENLTYGTTSNAPTGTADTAQYQYDWPKASTTVTGTESINETRTLLSYTVTWYKYGQSGETYAKRETLTYGSTSTAPTGNTDTAQYDYSWPKASTTVVGTESITETCVVKSYTITWKSYTNVTLKSETLAYGSTSTAPIGTSDTTEYAYTWPKSSTTVVAVETIIETRTAKSYTLTFEGNGATPSPTTKTVTFGQPYGTLATVSKTNWEHLGWYYNFDTHETPTIIAHWPLDGNLNDISGNKLHGVLQGATPNTEGKIGGSYTFANTRIYTVDFNSYLSTNAYTYTAWINRSSSQNDYNMFMGQGLPYFSFLSGGQLFWSNDVNGTQRTCITSETFNNNTWYHFTATYDGTYMKIFVNGVEKASSYQPGTMSPGWETPFSIGDGMNSTWYPFYGKVNDVRIYNEVLSVDEIKEIAQAKILHYTFDTCGEPTTNLWQGAFSIYNNLGIPATLQATGEYFKNAPVYRLTMTPSTQAQIDSIKANFWNHGVYGSSITYTANTKYHSSVYWKAINKSDIVVDGLASNIGGWASAANYIENGWTRCISYRDGSVAQNKTGHVFWSFKSPSATLGDSFIIDWCAPQIEQKDHATDYVLTTREGLLVDSSPYHRDAVMTTNYPAWDFTQNANGRASYRFNYTNQDYIALPYFTTDKQAITLSAWMRSNDITKSQNIISRNGPFFLRVTSSTLRVAVYTGTWVFANGSTILSSNTWYHLVMTYDGVRVKGYVNGVLDIDVAKTGDMASWTSTIRLGYTTGGEDAPMDGYIDDVRIYATALSQTDITLLYNTQTFITSGTTVRASKNHTIYAHWNPHLIGETLLNNIMVHGQTDTEFGKNLTISKLEELNSISDLEYINQTVFNITLDKQSGTGGTNNITGMTGESISPTSVTVPTRTNYTFGGYYTSTNGEGTQRINASGTYVALNNNTYVGNATLYAKWTMVDRTFSWIANPSTVGLKANVYIGGVSKGANVTSHSASYPANSVFKVSGLTIPAGWQYSSYSVASLTSVTTGGSGATTEVQGTGDMTSTATRSITTTIVGISYSISVTTNGGSGTKASVSTYTPKTSATTVTLTRGTKAGYRFISWTVSGANGKATLSGNTLTIPAYTTSVQPYGNLTITANWATAEASGENSAASVADIAYEAVAPITITLNKQSGTGGTNSIISVKGFYTDPTSVTVPTRTGYTFKGYYTATSGGTQRINASGTFVALTHSTYTSNATLYAQWTPITYTITRTLGTGVTAATINPTTYNIETANFTPTISGVTYATGYDSYTVSPTLVQILKGSTGNKSYTVSASKINYTITMNANGGSGGSNPTNYQINTSTQTRSFTLPTRTGYTLSSWTVTGHTGTIPTVSGSTVSIPANTYGNLTIKANWTPTAYTLTKGSIPTGVATFVVTRNTSPIGGGATGALNNGATIYYNDTFTITATGSNGYNTPTRSPGATHTATGSFTASVTAGSKITYTITADRNGGSGGNASATYVVTDSKTLATLLGTPTKSGAVASKWRATTASAGGWTKDTLYVPSTNVLNKYANVTLQLTWITTQTENIMNTISSTNSISYVNNYLFTITLNKQSGTGGTNSIAVVYGISLNPTSVTVPTRTGYTFKGYYTATSGGTQRINASGTFVALTHSTYTSNATLYAQWEPVTYTITLNKQSGTGGTNSIAVVYGTSLNPTSVTVPTRTNYTFNGYYTAASGGTQRINASGTFVSLTSTTYTSNATLYAQWEPVGIQVQYRIKDYGGSWGSYQTVYAQTSFTTFPNGNDWGYSGTHEALRIHANDVGEFFIGDVTIFTGMPQQGREVDFIISENFTTTLGTDTAGGRNIWYNFEGVFAQEYVIRTSGSNPVAIHRTIEFALGYNGDFGELYLIK